MVSRIVEEANREGAPLSEVERKMLYFSETDWTLPDIMQVNDEFDRNYDQNDYEKKITKLILKAAKHDRRKSRDEYDSWLKAIRILEREDHYMLVMVKQANLHPRGDQLKLLIAGLSVAFVVLGYVVLSSYTSDRYGSTFGRYLAHGTDRIIFYFIIAACALVLYRLGWISRF